MEVVRTRSGWLYVAVVQDLFSRKVVGWSMAASTPAQLVCETLHMAIARHRPPPVLLVHSDEAVSTPASCTQGCCSATDWCAA